MWLYTVLQVFTDVLALLYFNYILRTIQPVRVLLQHSLAILLPILALLLLPWFQMVFRLAKILWNHVVAQKIDHNRAGHKSMQKFFISRSISKLIKGSILIAGLKVLRFGPTCTVPTLPLKNSKFNL